MRSTRPGKKGALLKKSLMYSYVIYHGPWPKSFQYRGAVSNGCLKDRGAVALFPRCGSVDFIQADDHVQHTLVIAATYLQSNP